MKGNVKKGPKVKVFHLLAKVLLSKLVQIRRPEGDGLDFPSVFLKALLIIFLNKYSVDLCFLGGIF